MRGRLQISITDGFSRKIDPGFRASCSSVRTRLYIGQTITNDLGDRDDRSDPSQRTEFLLSLVSRDCSDDPKTGGLGSFREMAKKIKTNVEIQQVQFTRENMGPFIFSRNYLMF